MFPMTVSFTINNQIEFDSIFRHSAPAGPVTSGSVSPDPKPGKPKADKPAATSSAAAADAASAAPPKADASAPKVEAAGDPAPAPAPAAKAPAPAAKALDYMKDVAPKVAEAQTKDRAATIALLEKLGARGGDGKLKGSNVPASKLQELLDGLAGIIDAETVE